jgi:hypothetical protein
MIALGRVVSILIIVCINAVLTTQAAGVMIEQLACAICVGDDEIIIFALAVAVFVQRWNVVVIVNQTMVCVAERRLIGTICAGWRGRVSCMVDCSMAWCRPCH